MPEQNNNETYFSVRLKHDKRRAVVWKEIIRFLKPLVFSSQPNCVVEIGAGYCDFINGVTANRRFAIDQSAIIKEYAAPGVQTIVSPVTDLSALTNESVNCVLASNIFEHLSDTEFSLTLAEIKRILASQGKLVIVQPNFKFAFRDYFDDYTHKKIFTDVSLSQYLEANDFSIIKCHKKFLPYSLAKVGLPTPAWLIRAYLRSPWKPKAGQMLIIAQKK